MLEDRRNLDIGCRRSVTKKVTQLDSCTLVSKRRKKGKVPGTSKHGSLTCRSQSAESDWTHTRNDPAHRFLPNVRGNRDRDTYVWWTQCEPLGISFAEAFAVPISDDSSVTRILLDRGMVRNDRTACIFVDVRLVSAIDMFFSASHVYLERTCCVLYNPLRLYNTVESQPSSESMFE